MEGFSGVKMSSLVGVCVLPGERGTLSNIENLCVCSQGVFILEFKDLVICSSECLG